MLVWVAALHCEAKPIIDYYRLRKSASHHAFDVYQGDNMLCIISGIGKNAAASAVAWIAGLYRSEASIAWINIGTAGSASHEIGTPLWVCKISEPASKRHFYPIPLINSGLQIAQCQTLEQPSIDYHPDQIYDMEASALFEAATRFSSAELVHCLKIISDNPTQQTGRNKARISEIIHQHIAQFAGFAESLMALNNQLAALHIKDADWKKFLACAHFTQTQQTRVSKSLRFLLSRDFHTDKLIAEASNLQSANRIIDHLEKLCQLQTQDL